MRWYKLAMGEEQQSGGIEPESGAVIDAQPDLDELSQPGEQATPDVDDVEKKLNKNDMKRELVKRFNQLPFDAENKARMNGVLKKPVEVYKIFSMMSPQVINKLKTLLKNQPLPPMVAWTHSTCKLAGRFGEFDDGHFAPGEDPSKFGTPMVDVVGDNAHFFADIPGVKGHVNLQVSIQSMKQALENAFGKDFFHPITTIKVADLPGRFGQAVSMEPHTIYINLNAMVEAVHRAVEKESQMAAHSGVEAEFTPEIGRRINEEVAKLLWETIPHEMQHARDFQEQLDRISSGQSGDMAAVPEHHGEQAGKQALRSFRWYSR